MQLKTLLPPLIVISLLIIDSVSIAIGTKITGDGAIILFTGGITALSIVGLASMIVCCLFTTGIKTDCSPICLSVLGMLTIGGAIVVVIIGALQDGRTRIEMVTVGLTFLGHIFAGAVTLWIVIRYHRGCPCECNTCC